MEQWSNSTLSLRRTYRDYIKFDPKVLPGIFLDDVLYAVENLERADIEELEEMDASEIHARRLNAKEVLTPMNTEQSKTLAAIDV